MWAVPGSRVLKPTVWHKIRKRSGVTWLLARLPLLLHSPGSSSVCVCFSSFHTSLTLHIHFSLLPFRYHPTPTPRPTSNPLDVGIQFVLYVSFLLIFKCISCRLLLINSLYMRGGGGGADRQIKTPHIHQWVTLAIIYHLDSSEEAPCLLPRQPVPWWLIPRQCGIAAGNRACELSMLATSF